jgi:hypothetical protein
MPEFRRLALILTIGSFSIAALLGVVALLSGGEFGEGQVRVLLTTLCVGVTSVLALCYLATAETPYRATGALGALAAVLTLVVSLLMIWTGVEDRGNGTEWWRAFGVGSVASLTLAQACLLLVMVAGTSRNLQVALAGTLVAVAWVAGHVIVLIFNVNTGDGSWRLLGVMAILDVLGTVAVTALARFGGRRTTTARLDVPADLVPLVLARAERLGRSPEAVVRDALLAELEGRADGYGTGS